MISEKKESRILIDKIDQLRLRNPKNDDLGDIVAVNSETHDNLLSTLFLYDGKEIIIQKLNEDE